MVVHGTEVIQSLHSAFLPFYFGMGRTACSTQQLQAAAEWILALPSLHASSYHLIYFFNITEHWEGICTDLLIITSRSQQGCHHFVCEARTSHPSVHHYNTPSFHLLLYCPDTQPYMILLLHSQQIHWLSRVWKYITTFLLPCIFKEILCHTCSLVSFSSLLVPLLLLSLTEEI